MIQLLLVGMVAAYYLLSEDDRPKSKTKPKGRPKKMNSIHENEKIRLADLEAQKKRAEPKVEEPKIEEPKIEEKLDEPKAE